MTFKLGAILRDPPEVLKQRDRCASGKTVFYSKDEARREVIKIRRGKGPTNMRPYHCDLCPWWHLGHRRGNR